nr:cytochrome c peroxidase [uncultured Undibacterium sp.]
MSTVSKPASRIANSPTRHLFRALGLITLSVVLMSTGYPVFAQAQLPSANPTAALTRLENLGQRIFTDRNLSVPAGTSCASCHTANTGFANNNGSRIGVSQGSVPGALGLRNAMSNAYNSFNPIFSFKTSADGVEAIGGHFWDGRADTLALQALGPFLASAEMNNPDSNAVVLKVAAAPYADMMRAEFGNTIFSNPVLAYQKIGVAIAAFESSIGLQSFSSKYDAMIQGKATLTPNENRGMTLFMDPKKGNCAACHLMNPDSKNPKDSLFTEFTYYALGVPRNTAIPQNANPSFFDLGICGPARSKPALTSNVPLSVSIDDFCGKFKMPSLRNVAQRQAFMHNGFFKNLRDVVAFYATRNADPRRWYGAAGVPNDLPLAYQKNIVNDKAPLDRPRSAGPALSPAESEDIIAFLGTLSDGFIIAATPTTTPTPPNNPNTPPGPRVPPINPFGR